MGSAGHPFVMLLGPRCFVIDPVADGELGNLELAEAFQLRGESMPPNSEASGILLDVGDDGFVDGDWTW